MSTRDLDWLAGILEGEGCFRLHGGSTPVIKLAMTDLDVVERAARIMGATVKSYPDRQRPHIKPVYEFRVGSKRAVAWMMTLYPLMGERRRTRIRVVLACWRQLPGSGHRLEAA